MNYTQIEEHMEVVGTDGEHVETVDGVEGNQIKLTKSDGDAGGEYHFIPILGHRGSIGRGNAQ